MNTPSPANNVPASTNQATGPAPHRGISQRGTLFHPVNGDGCVTTDWYTRIVIEGQRRVLNLGPRKADAVLLDEEARRRVRDGATFESVRTWIEVQLAPDRSAGGGLPGGAAGTSVTLGQIIEVHKATYFEALTSTTYRYEISLLNLVETAVRRRDGLPPVTRSGQRVTFADYPAILKLPATILTDQLVTDFKAARMEGVVRKSATEMSHKRSANTELRQARCVFSAEARLAYKAAGLELPNLTSFLTAPRFKNVKTRPQLPHDNAINALFASLRALATEGDPGVFTAVTLAVFGGLRRNEIRHALGAWLQRSAGPSIVIRLDETYRPKGYTERTVPLPDWLFTVLAATPADAHLIPGDANDRERTLDGAVMWLRANGFQSARKPLHLLRGLYAAYLLATERSPFRVKSRLGHADLTTTFTYYADEPLADALVAHWTTPIALPARNTAAA